MIRFSGVLVGREDSRGRTMVVLHGTLNAIGFGLLGLLGWRLTVPAAPRAGRADSQTPERVRAVDVHVVDSGLPTVRYPGLCIEGL